MSADWPDRFRRGDTNEPPLTEADLDARIRERRDEADDALDQASHVSYPEWSDELDAIDRDASAWLRRVAIGIIVVSLGGVVLALTIGPLLLALRS